MTYATVKIDGKEGFVGKMADTAEAIGCVMDYLSNKFTCLLAVHLLQIGGGQVRNHEQLGSWPRCWCDCQLLVLT